MPYSEGTDYRAQDAYGTPVPASTTTTAPPPAYIPGSTYVPPPPSYGVGGGTGVGSVPPPPPSTDRYMPGPPTNYVPGSTYVPPPAVPPPATPATGPMTEPPPVNPAYVPGSGYYRATPESQRLPEEPSPGLGAGGSPPRPLAPRSGDMWTPVDPHEPQQYIPGSSYVPNYIGMAPLGSPARRFRPLAPSMQYGGPGSAAYAGELSVPMGVYDDLTFTTYPASGAQETVRASGATDPRATVLREGNAPPRPWPVAGIPGTTQPRSDTLNQMEWGRQMRGTPPPDPRTYGARLRDLFG
jgi:hypothetical protein